MFSPTASLRSIATATATRGEASATADAALVEQSMRADARWRLRQCKGLLQVAGLARFYPTLRDFGAVSE
jgi:hypothetical protein